MGRELLVLGVLPRGAGGRRKVTPGPCTHNQPLFSRARVGLDDFVLGVFGFRGPPRGRVTAEDPEYEIRNEERGYRTPEGQGLCLGSDFECSHRGPLSRWRGFSILISTEVWGTGGHFIVSHSYDNFCTYT